MNWFQTQINLVIQECSLVLVEVCNTCLKQGRHNPDFPLVSAEVYTSGLVTIMRDIGGSVNVHVTSHKAHQSARVQLDDESTWLCSTMAAFSPVDCLPVATSVQLMCRVTQPPCLLPLSTY